MKLLHQKWFYVLADGILSILTFYMAAILRFAGVIDPVYLIHMPSLAVVAAGTLILGGLLCGTYNSLWSYMGFDEMFRQLGAACVSALVLFVIKLIGAVPISGSMVVIYCVLAFLFTTAVRGLSRFRRWCDARWEIHTGKSLPAVVVGAGNAGSVVIRRLQDSPMEGFYPVALVDDDPMKQGRRISGIPVAGTVSGIAKVCDKYGAKQIVIAIPTATEEQLNHIHSICATTKLPVKLFQNVNDIDDYFRGNSRALRDISIEDLLFRDTVKPNMAPVYEFLRGKCVLVTGGVGSIGSEICRQVLEHGCSHLVIFDIHENGLFAINEELKEKYPPDRYSLCVGSVRDQERLAELMERFHPEMVFHAAAHKHVPMMELNPMEAIKNNVFGTKYVLEACATYGVKRFILISTDKAVNPTNIMGATKRMAELLVQSMNGQGGCEMAAVRFGNVLGSNGSVVPTFRKQIEAGGPVTVTDKEMRRYFRMIPEAVSLVLSAGTLAKGGEVFVLDMGKPIKIYDLACSMIRLAGYEPDKDIPIKIIGLRPGEKLFEEIALDNEIVDHTSHDKIFVLRNHYAELQLPMEELKMRLQNKNVQAARDLVFTTIGQARG